MNPSSFPSLPPVRPTGYPRRDGDLTRAMSPQPRESWPYRFVRGFVRLLLRAFFREIEVEGLENIPLDRGGLFVAWHPNALVDPALIFATAPRAAVFGARHGLFRVPLLGALLRAMGTVPIYRASDSDAGTTEDRRRRNRDSLGQLATRIAGGAWSALFPEGESHDLPHMANLKSGAARLYYRARTLGRDNYPTPAIIPVGLHYDRKLLFRSRALVWFHPPLELPEDLDVTPDEEEDETVGRQRARELTQIVEQSLTEVVLATEDWTIHRLLHRGSRIVQAERAARSGRKTTRSSVRETTEAFARMRRAYYLGRATMPDRVRKMRSRVRRYDAELRILGIRDRDLDGRPRLGSPWLPLLMILQAVFVFLLIPPVLAVGYVVNVPAAVIVSILTRLGARKKKDVASLKILVGAIIFPLFWVGIGVIAALIDGRLRKAFPSLPANPILVGGVMTGLAIVGGLISIRYIRLTRETTRSLRIRLTRVRRRKSISRLLHERGLLYDELIAIAQELDVAPER